MIKPTKKPGANDRYDIYEKPTMEQLAAQSRRNDTIAQRESKRQQKLKERRGIFPVEVSSLAAAAT